MNDINSNLNKSSTTHQITNFYNLDTLGLSMDDFSTTDFAANIKMITDSADIVGGCEQLTFVRPFSNASNMGKSVLAKMQTDLGYQFDCYIDLVINKYNTETAHVYVYTQGLTSYAGYALYTRVRFSDNVALPFILLHHPNDGYLYHPDDIGYVRMAKDGDYYYFRPYESDKVMSGSSNNPWYKVYTNRLEVLTNRITCLPTYSNTVSSATNMYVGTTGIISRTTNTSSKTIKHDIKELENIDLLAKNLYNVGVYQFKYNDGIITDENDYRYGKDLVGFIIEDLDAKYPIAVDKPSEDVKEWTWNAQYLIPPMLKLIQEQKEQINALEEKIENL